MNGILLRIFLLISCFTSCSTQQKSDDRLSSDQVDTALSASVDTFPVLVDSVDVSDPDDQGTGMIASYEVDLSFQKKFITIGDKQHTVWSILEHVFSDEDEEVIGDAGNSVSDVEVWQKSYTNEQGTCTNRSIITLKRINDYTHNSFDIIFPEYDGVELKVDLKTIDTFASNRANIREESIKVVPGYALGDACETFAVEYFNRGEDDDERWLVRTLLFFIAKEHFFDQILQIDLENNAEFFGANEHKSSKSICSIEILKQKTNGMSDVKIVCNTTGDILPGSSTEIYQWNGKMFLE